MIFGIFLIPNSPDFYLTYEIHLPLPLAESGSQHQCACCIMQTDSLHMKTQNSNLNAQQRVISYNKSQEQSKYRLQMQPILPQETPFSLKNMFS